MKLLPPDSLKNSRVYFTEFDRVTYSQVAWTAEDVEAIRRNMERKLKLVALIKGHVVIAASHLLESELANEVLFPYPRLFSEGVVVPALRSEFTAFEEFLNSKLAEGKESAQYEGGARREMAQMLDSQVALAVRWEVNQTSGWFKERLLSDLTDEQSLLRSCLRKDGVVLPPMLVSQMSEVPRPSRQDVYLLAKKTGDKNLWHTMCEYTDFIYYLSGAKAVSSEGLLPQENLLDFSLSDLTGGHTHLTETEVFFKLFVDLVKAATYTHFPVDMLDSLTIDDVLDLHSVAVEEKFVEKYNAIQEKIKDGLTIHDPERLVLLMGELEQFEQQLRDEYHAAINKELPRYLSDRKKTKAAKFLNATACLIVSPWGLVTGARDLVVSGLELSGMGKIANEAQRRVQRRIKACSRLLDRTTGLEGKPILLEFVKRMQERYAEKMLGI
jgi:hypothetical protein